MDRDLEKKKLNAEYKYLKAELEYQQAIFEEAQKGFDEYFRDKLDMMRTGKAAEKAKADKPKIERREEVDVIYKESNSPNIYCVIIGKIIDTPSMICKIPSIKNTVL